MTIHSFLDDYSEGCHPQILEALAATNETQQTAYGNDDYTAAARRLIADACGRPDLPVFLVGGGTLANLIVCSALLRPHEAIISAATGHMATRETGAIEATGHKIITMPSADGRLTADGVHAAMAANGHAPHMAKPRLVYISDATEFGTVYRRSELEALRAACDEHGLLLLVDGARLGVALANDIAAIADVFWIGGTKAGTLFGEAIVFPRAELAEDFEFFVKQRGALLAKGRVLGVQFQTLFTDGLFDEASAYANGGAAHLAAGIRAAGYELAAEPESNQVFAILPNTVIDALSASFAFYTWEPHGDDASVVRLVTSWATPTEQIDHFLAALTDG